MTKIEQILTTGLSARDEVPTPTENELRRVEEKIDFRFPASYREFVFLGGLSELRIHHRVLSPAQILEHLRFLPNRNLVPFADNGCGDYFCWALTEEAEPVVLFADHDSDYACNQVTGSFTQWLEKERF